MQRRTNIRAGLINAGVLVSTLLFLGLSFEGYLWVRYEAAHQRLGDRHPDAELCTRQASNPKLIYDFVPGTKCDVNAHGFMDLERQFDKPTGTFRIVLIGDSVAQGQGVPRSSRFGNLLESRLNRDLYQPLEVINLARSGYSTSQELIVLREHALRFEPDLVIWSYVLNDPAHPIFHNANGELGEYFYKPTWRGLHYFKRKIFKVKENALHGQCGSEFHRLLHCAYRDQVRQEIAQIGDIARADNLPVVFLIHPIFDPKYDPDNPSATYGSTDIHQDLTHIATDAGLQVVDLLEPFASFPTAALAMESKFGGWDPWHPNPKGHQLIADYLFSTLSGVVPGINL